MLLLGLLLVVAGALAILAALFGMGEGTVEVLGNDLNGLTIFLFGVGAGAAVLWGFTLARFGAKRTLRHRRESRELNELSQKLEQAEAERRGEDSDQS